MHSLTQTTKLPRYAMERPLGLHMLAQPANYVPSRLCKLTPPIPFRRFVPSDPTLDSKPKLSRCKVPARASRSKQSSKPTHRARNTNTNELNPRRGRRSSKWGVRGPGLDRDGDNHFTRFFVCMYPSRPSLQRSYVSSQSSPVNQFINCLSIYVCTNPVF